MNMILTGLLWLGYLALITVLNVPGVHVGALPVLAVAGLWTLIVEGLRKLLVRKPIKH